MRTENIVAGVSSAARDRWLFVSYAREDFAEYAEPFVAALRLKLAGRPELGYRPERVFFDRDKIHGGEVWEAKINAVLESCGALILLLSHDSLVSTVCMNQEVHRAVELGLPVVPVLIRECVWEDNEIPGDRMGRRLRQLSALPTDKEGRLVAVKNWSDRDGAWKEVVNQVAAALGARGGAVTSDASEDFEDARELAPLYVEPDLQDFNPPEEFNESSLSGSREPAFRFIERILQKPLDERDGHRCLFVLGDAGMGKTSLLQMLHLRHQSTPLPGVKHCVLLKLGRDTVARIAALRDERETLLLLDSLDEDPTAFERSGHAEGRLRELLPRLCRFRRVILTCRTQFFPEDSRPFITKSGHFVLDSFECPLKYLSLFDDRQVEECLRRRFDARVLPKLLGLVTTWRWEHPRLAEARKVASSMDTLRMRPLLLKYIEDFVHEDGSKAVDFRNRYALYHRLVECWLLRDAPKLFGITPAEGWQVATRLALHMARTGVKCIPVGELPAVAGLSQLPRFTIESRSLLNRTSGGHFQFAHATIFEFLLAHAVLDAERGYEVKGIVLTREAHRFLKAGSVLRSQPRVDLRGARLEFRQTPDEWLRKRFDIELVEVPAGEFWMGSPGDELGRSADDRRHRVRITQPFWIGRFPVTQAEYLAVMGENPSQFRGDRLPVEQVDWNMAMEFCRRLNEQARGEGGLDEGQVFRLPTEAEWEYACRAGTESAFNDGSPCTKPVGNDPALGRLGWFDENSGLRTHPVGEKIPNAWGLHDMHGNVWEWCLDAAGSKYVAELEVDPFQPSEGEARRIVRGGSAWNFAGGCRSASRIAFEPGDRSWFLGFRLAAGQEPPSGAGGSGR